MATPPLPHVDDVSPQMPPVSQACLPCGPSQSTLGNTIKRSFAEDPEESRSIGLKKRKISEGSVLSTVRPLLEAHSQKNANAKPCLEGIPAELAMKIVRELRLSGIVSLSIASTPMRELISDPANQLLNIDAVVYWFWGSDDNRSTPLAQSERNLVRFRPPVPELKAMLDFLCKHGFQALIEYVNVGFLTHHYDSGNRDLISEPLYDRFIEGMPDYVVQHPPIKRRIIPEATPVCSPPSPPFQPEALLRKIRDKVQHGQDGIKQNGT